MLKIGGYLNIIIAIAHIIGLFWAEQMFEKTGAGEGVKELSQIHYSFPDLLTPAANRLTSSDIPH